MSFRIILVVLLAVLSLGCATGQVAVQSAAPAAQAAVQAKPAEQPAKAQEESDYLGSGVKIAAVRLVSWEDTAMMAKAWPVKVEREATTETENKHKVAPAVAMDKDYAASESWKWTPFVFKEELAVGRFVLMAGEHPSTEKIGDLRATPWRLRKLSSLSKLYEELVEVSYYEEALRFPQ